MNSNSSMMTVGTIEAQVLRKPIKNLHLCVLPPSGDVRVTAPLGMKDDAIRALIATKLIWIKKQRVKFENQKRETNRKYISGETHFYLGKRYRLEVIYKDKPPRVELRGKNKIILVVRPRTSINKREKIIREWYRTELRPLVEKYVNRWEKKIGVKTKMWGIKRMKTRWGTCNQKSGRVWLNLELAKKPIECIEYVIVHELVHLIERTHSEKFVRLMTKHLPKWRSDKDELNRFILAHEEWVSK